MYNRFFSNLLTNLCKDHFKILKIALKSIEFIHCAIELYEETGNLLDYPRESRANLLKLC